MNKPVALIVLLSIAVTALLPGCTSSLNPAMGGSSGTEVSSYIVTGSVVNSGGQPVYGATVRLRPAAFLSDSLLSTYYTDSHTIVDTLTLSDGSFVVPSVRPDSYNIEVTFRDSLGVVIPFRANGDKPAIRLSIDTVRPMAILTGTLKMVDDDSAQCLVQVYGLDRSIAPDSQGNFSLHLPPGNNIVHIGAFSADPGKPPKEIDGMNITLGMNPGENKNIGDMQLQPPPPSSCTTFSCDSMTVRKILDAIGLPEIAVDSAVSTANGRVTGLLLRGRTVTNKFPPELLSLTELTIIDLGRTGLTSVYPDLGKAMKLQTIRLDSNHLTRIPSSIGSLQQLTEFNLSANDIDTLPPTLTNLQRLTLLDLAGNKLCRMDSTRTAWADRFDPDWKDSQRCP
jgi:hypothetical protein